MGGLGGTILQSTSLSGAKLSEFTSASSGGPFLIDEIELQQDSDDPASLPIPNTEL